MNPTLPLSTLLEQKVQESETRCGEMKIIRVEDGENGYDAGYLSTYGGGDIGWWQDYIRAEIARCNEWWKSRLEDDPIPGLEERVKELVTGTYCAYCGERYPLDDEAATAVRSHIASCPKHPMTGLGARVEELELSVQNRIAEIAGLYADLIVKNREIESLRKNTPLPAADRDSQEPQAVEDSPPPVSDGLPGWGCDDTKLSPENKATKAMLQAIQKQQEEILGLQGQVKELEEIHQSFIEQNGLLLRGYEEERKMVKELQTELAREKEGSKAIEEAYLAGKWPLGIEPPEAGKRIAELVIQVEELRTQVAHRNRALDGAALDLERAVSIPHRDEFSKRMVDKWLTEAGK